MTENNSRKKGERFPEFITSQYWARSLDTCWRKQNSQHANDVNSAGCVGCGIEDLDHCDLQIEEEGPGHVHRASWQVK